MKTHLTIYLVEMYTASFVLHPTGRVKHNKRIHNMLILVYKSLFLTNYPNYMKNMFTLRSTIYNLRGNYILTLCMPKTTTYGLRSFSYHAAYQWNSLPDFLRTASFNDFKKVIAKLDFM